MKTKQTIFPFDHFPYKLLDKMIKKTSFLVIKKLQVLLNETAFLDLKHKELI
jgi:hypothetical protein